MNIIETIQKRFPNLPEENFKVQVDGDNYFISHWEASDPEPTAEELTRWITEDAGEATPPTLTVEELQQQLEEQKAKNQAQEEELQQQLEEQKAKNQAQEQQTAQVNADLVAFMDFYFAQP